MKSAAVGGFGTKLLCAVALLGSLAVEGFALPLGPNRWEEIFEHLQAGEHRNLQPSQEQLNKRDANDEVRSYYGSEAFINRPYWNSRSCDATYNCAPVNPAHCIDGSGVVFTVANKVTHVPPLGCELAIEVQIDESEVVKGAELALFKKTEQYTGDHLKYYIFAVYRPEASADYSSIAAQHLIDWSCSSWQVMDIGGIKDELPAGTHKINLLVAVFKETIPNQPIPTMPVLNCNQIRSLFIMDANASLSEFTGIEEKPEMPTAPNVEQMENNQVEQDKDNLSAVDNDDAKSEMVQKSASGSGVWENLVAATVGPPPPPAISEVQKYMPTLAIIKTGGNPIEKRSVKSNYNHTEPLKNDSIKGKEATDGVATTVVTTETTEAPKTDPTKGVNIINTTEPLLVEESTQSQEFVCVKLENKLDLSEEFPTIILQSDQERVVDIGKCSHSTDTMECRATLTNLEILVKNEGRVTVSGYYKTIACTAFNKTQPTTAVPYSSTQSLR